MDDRDEGRIIGVNCPECSSELSLRMPADQRSGEFAFTCSECGSEQNLSIGEKGVDRFRTISSRKALRKAVEVPSESSVRKTKLKVSAAFLIIAGILGLTFSILTVTGSFTLKDIEQQTEGESTTLTVAVIDSVTGRPIADVRVSVSGENGNMTGYTNPAGLHVIQGIGPGRSVLSLSKDGYKTVRSDINLRTGTPNVLDIPMEAGSPAETIPIRTAQFEPKEYSTLVTDVMAGIMFLTSVISFAAAYFTYRGELFALALVCSFLAIFSFGFVIGAGLALAATIIVTFSYDEFTHPHVLKRILDLRRRGVILGRLRKERG